MPPAGCGPQSTLEDPSATYALCARGSVGSSHHGAGKGSIPDLPDALDDLVLRYSHVGAVCRRGTGTGPPLDHRAIIRGLADCIDFMRPTGPPGRSGRRDPEARSRGRPGDQDRGRPPGRGARRGRGAVREPRGPGAGARAGRSPGRQPPRPDLGGRPRRAVERLALAAQPPGQRPRRDRDGSSS